MRNSVLPVMTVLTVTAGAVGLQLGESAIAQIDPVYFEAVVPPRDVTKDPRPPRSPGFAEASDWEEGYKALAADCGGCAPVVQRVNPAPAAPLFAYTDATIEPRWQQAAQRESVDELRIERSVESAQVQRYLHYPVSADQAEIRASLEGEAPASARNDGPTGL